MATKKKYRCTTCNWKFSRNFKPTLCPYCGRATVEEQPMQEANDIVKEVDKLGK